MFKMSSVYNEETLGPTDQSEILTFLPVGLPVVSGSISAIGIRPICTWLSADNVVFTYASGRYYSPVFN